MIIKLIESRGSAAALRLRRAGAAPLPSNNYKLYHHTGKIQNILHSWDASLGIEP
jgi:hypothetical protein